MTQLEATYDKKHMCIMCNQPFTSKKVRSKFIKVEKYDTDFLPYYASEDANPLLYHIQICPNCGYSFSEEFTSYFPAGGKELMIESVCSKWGGQSFSSERTIEKALSTYKLAIYCASLKKEKNVTVAGLYLRLSWLYRITGNAEQEKRFAALAMHAYIESYTTDDFKGSKMSEVRVLYLIAELSRRTGQTEQAIKYFSRVFEQQKRATEPKIIEMAREQWGLMKENI